MKFKLNEATTSNIFKRLTDDKTCAIISGCIDGNSEEENKLSMTKLKSRVRNDLKLGYNQFVSRWVDNGMAFDEWALLIPNISYDDAIKVGEEFEQKSIIYKDSNSCREICTTPFISNGISYNKEDVIRTYNTSGNHFMNIKDAEEIFKRKVGGASSMPIKGSNKKPFTLKTEGLEIFEMFDPKPSYFQTECSYKKIR